MSVLDIFSLKDRVALITGSSKGLGWTMAQALSGAGAHVVLNSRKPDELAPRVKDIEKAGGTASMVPFDVTDAAAIKGAIERIERDHGHLDILVNNAGIVNWSPLHETTEEQWHAVLNADLTACWRLAKEASRGMVQRGWGRIINISSVMGRISLPLRASYLSAKEGVHGLTRALAVELGPKGVNVNCIGPGFFPGTQNEVVRRDKAFYDRVSNRAPLGRWGIPDELAGAVIYFASPASSFCNGQVLMVDGGMTIAF